MGLVYFVTHIIIVITLVSGTRGGSYEDDYDGDLSSLGQRISNQIRAGLAPLYEKRITDGPLRSLNTGQMNRDIQSNVQQSLSGLENLGAQITQSVQASLEPVRALEVKAKMINGIGGITIAKHLPSGTTFVIQNHKTYKCDGQISFETGQCQGNLVPYEFSTNSDDVCYLNSYSRVNDKLCFASGGVSVSITNNVISCQGSYGSPAVMMTIDEYKKKCGDQSKQVKYTYIPNLSDPNHVQIPNQNKYVKCENSTPQRCEFTESSAMNINSFGSSIVNYNNGGSYYQNNGNFYSY